MAGAVQAFSAGDLVTWLCEARGGYGYVQRVLGTVVSVGPKRVRIAVQRKTRTGYVPETKWVKPANLVRRNGE